MYRISFIRKWYINITDVAFPKQYLFSNWGVTTWLSEILNLSPIKFVKYTTMNILWQLTKAGFALKRKFDDLKQVKNYTNLQLEKTFKPITKPLPANGTKGKWRYASSKARLKCATYRRKTDLSFMDVRVGVANFFWINR